MAADFPDKIHPKNKLRLRFDYWARPIQYLEYFNIVTTYPECKFLPLNLSFSSQEELQEFLYYRGIIYDEIDVSHFYSQLSNEVTIVDTSKIYEIEETVLKYLNNYKYYSINEVADMLSFSRPTVYKWVNDQSLKAIRINGQLRIKHSDLTEFIKKENKD